MGRRFPNTVIITVIALLLWTVVSCAGQPEEPGKPANGREQMIAGGYSPIEADHPKVIEAIEFLTERLGPRYPEHRITGVVRAEMQVVAGYNIRLLLYFTDGDKTGTLEAVVYTSLDGEHQLRELAAAPVQ